MASERARPWRRARLRARSCPRTARSARRRDSRAAGCGTAARSPGHPARRASRSSRDARRTRSRDRPARRTPAPRNSPARAMLPTASGVTSGLSQWKSENVSAGHQHERGRAAGHRGQQDERHTAEHELLAQRCRREHDGRLQHLDGVVSRAARVPRPVGAPHGDRSEQGDTRRERAGAEPAGASLEGPPRAGAQRRSRRRSSRSTRIPISHVVSRNASSRLAPSAAAWSPPGCCSRDIPSRTSPPPRAAAQPARNKC